MCKHAVKKVPYLLRYVPDQYKTQQMCNKAILENGGTLKSTTDCYKDQEISNKAVENQPHASHALEFVPEYSNMCDKTVNTYLFTIEFVPECYKLKNYVIKQL